MLSVIRYSLYGELQPIPCSDFEPGTWKLELLTSDFSLLTPISCLLDFKSAIQNTISQSA